MIYDLQKADIWKRASAGLFDLILKIIGAVGFILLLSLILGFEGYADRYEDRQEVFEAQYGVDFDAFETSEDYEKLTESERQLIDKAFGAFAADDEANYLFNMLFQLTLITVVFGILLSYLVFDFIIPLLFKNGQTLGKKIFGIAVMRTDNVRINGPILFTRSILGKYTVETMVPVMLVLMTAFGAIGGLGIIVAAIVLLTNIVMMLVTKTNSAIHDMLANTVTVDFASQMIFDTPEDLLAYKQKIHEENVEKASY